MTPPPPSQNDEVQRNKRAELEKTKHTNAQQSQMKAKLRFQAALKGAGVITSNASMLRTGSFSQLANRRASTKISPNPRKLSHSATVAVDDPTNHVEAHDHSLSLYSRSAAVLEETSAHHGFEITRSQTTPATSSQKNVLV